MSTDSKGGTGASGPTGAPDPNRHKPQRTVNAEAADAAGAAGGDTGSADKPDPAIESQARVMGHISKEDWIKQGKPEKDWRDPKDFLAVGRENNKILRERVDKLTSTITDLQAQAELGTAAMQELVKLKNTAETRGYEKARKELLKEHARAVKDGDGDRAAETLDKLDALEKPKEEPVPQPAKAPVQTPEMLAWKTANPWYGADKDMSVYADRIGRGYSQELAQTKEAVTPQQFLDYIQKEVRERFPDKFEKKRTSPPSPDAGNDSSAAGGPGGGGKKGKTFSDLPPDAKDAWTKTLSKVKVKGKPMMTEAQYVKDYFGQEAA